MRNHFIVISLVSAVSSCFFISADSQAQDFSWPVPGCERIGSDYGERGNHFHRGIDISCFREDSVVAAYGGIITSIGHAGSGKCIYNNALGTCESNTGCQFNGNNVKIQHNHPTTGEIFYSHYLHLESFAPGIETGAYVNCGQKIGDMGSTGCSTARHLHFTLTEGSLNWNDSVDPKIYVIPDVNICAEAQDLTFLGMITDPESTDVDGDGKADICVRGSSGILCTLSKTGDLISTQHTPILTDEDGWNDISNYSTIHFADFNGDGLADICARSNKGIQCWPSNGKTFGNPTNVISMMDERNYDMGRYYSTIHFADINGDGKDDACARYMSGFYCYLSYGDHWPEEEDYIFLDYMKDNQGWTKPEYYSTIRMADVNGDGKADVCARDANGFRCWISKGTSFSEDFPVIPWTDEAGFNKPKYYATIRMPDINGDGKADACIRDKEGIKCYPSDGTKFGKPFSSTFYSDVNLWGEIDHFSTLIFADFNGDNKDDFCIRGNHAIFCVPSTGTGFGKAIKIADFGDEKEFNKANQYRTIRMGDIDGDGKAEVCGRFPDGIKCYHYNNGTFTSVNGPALKNSNGWNLQEYYSTLRLGGPIVKTCHPENEICDQIDNNCNGEIDEGNVCCKPSEEICDQKDNDCDGEIDEGGVCDQECIPEEEICDQKDNDCDGQIDEDGVCDQECIPEEEICDQKDNDCDGQIDEDGVCDKNDECIPEKEICDQKDNDCDGQIDEDGVCDKNDECIPEKEICDQKDNDCDGQIDEGGVCDKNDEENGEDDIAGSSPDACSGTPIAPAKAPVGTGLLFAGLLAALLLRRKETIRNDKRA